MIREILEEDGDRIFKEISRGLEAMLECTRDLE
jgi:hypothetical protein